MALLEVSNLGIAFGGLQAVSQLDLKIEKGHLYGLIGPNGAGKTTVFNMLTGVYKPTEGNIVLDGNDITGATPEAISKAGIARTFQNIRLFNDMTVLDNVKVGLHNQVVYGMWTGILRLPSFREKEHEMDRRAMKLLKIFDLDAEANYKASQLPYGKQRKLEIARALATNPKLLLLDEPAAGLDPEGRDDILSEVKEYHKKTGTTVLLVSHSMEDIAKYANRVLVMSNKKIAMYDTVEKVFARAPELLELGLSVPQVTKIFLKLREMGVDVPADVYTVPYAVKMILEAKKRRDAGESLVLPRVDAKKGGAATC